MKKYHVGCFIQMASQRGLWFSYAQRFEKSFASLEDAKKYAQETSKNVKDYAKKLNPKANTKNIQTWVQELDGDCFKTIATF